MSRMSFLYRVIRSSTSGLCSGDSASNAGNTLCSHLYSSIHEIKGVIFDMDGTLTVPVLNFNQMRTSIGLPVGTDILTAVLNMPLRERERAMKIIEEFEDEGERR